MYIGIILHLISRLSFVLGSYGMHFFLGRYLTEAQYGIVGTIVTIMNFEYVFFTDGVRQGMAKAIAMGRYDEKKLIRTGFLFQMLIVLIFFAGTFFGAPFIADMLGDVTLIPYIRNLAWLLPFTGIYSLCLGVLNGHKDFKKEAGTSTLYPILKLSVIPFVLLVFADAVLGTQSGYLFAAVLIALISMTMVFSIRKQFGCGKEVMGFREYAKTALSYILLFGASTIMMNVDTLILKKVSGDNELVGYYTGVANFAKVPYYLLTAFYTVVLPVVSSAWARNALEEAREKISQVLSMALAIVLPVVIVMAAASGSVLSLFYKESYGTGADALSFLLFAIGFLGVMLIFCVVLSAADKKAFIGLISMGVLILQVIFCFVLTEKFSLTGTALGTFLATFAGMVICGINVYKTFGNFIKIKQLLLMAVELAAYAGLYYLFRNVFDINNFAVLVCVCGAAFTVLALFGLWSQGLLQKAGGIFRR